MILSTLQTLTLLSFINREMRMMLEEEIARAILIGDGREFDDPDKIDETKIRPIINDNEFFTVRKSIFRTCRLCRGCS